MVAKRKLDSLNVSPGGDKEGEIGVIYKKHLSALNESVLSAVKASNEVSFSRSKDLSVEMGLWDTVGFKLKVTVFLEGLWGESVFDLPELPHLSG